MKFVPSLTLWPVRTALPTCPWHRHLTGRHLVAAGIFFGVGDGLLYVNDDATASPFNTAAGNKYSLEVDLTTEPNSPAGTGTQTTCVSVDPNDNSDPNFAGHLACYKRERSLGLFQKMRTDNMHVGVMFVNADTGQGGSLQFSYDEAFNASDVTVSGTSKSKQIPLSSEALYEGLCLFRKSQGPCYSNSGSWSTGYSSGGIGAVGDPFYFASMNQMVRCAKCFVLMISPGIGVKDGDAPDLQSPFGNLFTGANIGDGPELRAQPLVIGWTMSPIMGAHTICEAISPERKTSGSMRLMPWVVQLARRCWPPRPSMVDSRIGTTTTPSI